MTTNTPIDDSPHELNNGAWVPRGAIVVWEQWGPPASPPDGIPVDCLDCQRSLADHRHFGRGLCRACYSRHRRDGSLVEYPRFKGRCAA